MRGSGQQQELPIATASFLLSLPRHCPVRRFELGLGFALRESRDVVVVRSDVDEPLHPHGGARPHVVLAREHEDEQGCSACPLSLLAPPQEDQEEYNCIAPACSCIAP